MSSGGIRKRMPISTAITRNLPIALRAVWESSKRPVVSMIYTGTQTSGAVTTVTDEAKN
jgi:hypothetical protein